MSEELKPCPFCGNKDVILSDYRLVGNATCWKITCRHCRLVMSGVNKQLLRNSWNTRPAEDDLKAEVERLKEVLVEIAATLATGAEISEDDIFMMCKDAIGEKAVLDRYNEKLRKRKCNE